jgi:hypothetical protein
MGHFSAGIFLLVSYSLFRLVNAADLAWLFVIAGFQLNIETTTHFLTVERFRNNQRREGRENQNTTDQRT